jgi:hypothetical protein
MADSRRVNRCRSPVSQFPLAGAADGTRMGRGAPGYGSDTVRPGWLMVPGAQYHVIIFLKCPDEPARQGKHHLLWR